MILDDQVWSKHFCTFYYTVQHIIGQYPQLWDNPRGWLVNSADDFLYIIVGTMVSARIWKQGVQTKVS